MYAVKKGKQEKIEPPPFRARAPAEKRNCAALRSRRAGLPRQNLDEFLILLIIFL